MPKKQSRNAFYFFMMDFKERQQKEGINYGNMGALADAAGKIWKDAPPHIRAKFQEKANKGKKTSTGVSLEEIERREQALKDAEEDERLEIRNIVKLKYFNDAIIQEIFCVMDINYFCKAGSQYVIAESTVLRFNLRDGVLDHYHEMIHPGEIPLGYAYDAKMGSHEIGLKIPDESQRRSNYFQILTNMIDYLKQRDQNAKTLPPVFTMPDKVAPIKDFIAQMCRIAAEDDGAFRVYKLDGLFFTLVNALASRSDEGFPRESLALAQLTKDPFKYTPGLGCKVHEARDKSFECSTARAKRWAFTVLDSCCPLRGIEMLPGRHVPDDFDVNAILTLKEERKERARPSVAGLAVASLNTSAAHSDSFNNTINDTTIDTTFDTTLDTTNDTINMSMASTSSGQKRVHVPLRKPKMDYSQTIRTEPEFTEPNSPSLSAGRDSQTIRPAPEFTEPNFPSLSAGRGRGLARRFSKLNIQE